ncbi:hypothetical protein N7490_010058 [Penicillium lividum]|nr:hypothetical protein N7490_010058 [Penicillium lividum]
MSFHNSACDIHLSKDDYCTYLTAICNNEEGCGLNHTIPLDDYLGNENGHFSWGGKNFSHDARNTSLTREGPDKRPFLHSELRDSSGHFVSNDIDLASHIANIDGELVFKQ